MYIGKQMFIAGTEDRDKMLIYKFYKTDITEKMEYDIDNDNYRELLSVCFEHSKIMSLLYYDDNSEIRKKLKKFQIPKATNISFTNDYGAGEIVYYRICEELYKILTGMSNGIFEKWIYNWRMSGPVDPTFYRDDGSVFLNVITHDGEIALRPRENENVSNIVTKEGWLTHDNDWRATRAGVCVNCVPNESAATAIAKIVFENINIPNKKRELKFLETTFDISKDKWVTIFAKENLEFLICKILIDKETGATEVFFEST